LLDKKKSYTSNGSLKLDSKTLSSVWEEARGETKEQNLLHSRRVTLHGRLMVETAQRPARGRRGVLCARACPAWAEPRWRLAEPDGQAAAACTELMHRGGGGRVTCARPGRTDRAPSGGRRVRRQPPPSEQHGTGLPGRQGRHDREEDRRDRECGTLRAPAIPRWPSRSASAIPFPWHALPLALGACYWNRPMNLLYFQFVLQFSIITWIYCIRTLNNCFTRTIFMHIDKSKPQQVFIHCVECHHFSSHLKWNWAVPNKP
jgi:hypothetical protein